MIKNLNLGSGGDYKKGWINIDRDKTTNPDIIMDIDKPKYPWKDSTFDVVYLSHVLEHMTSFMLHPIKYMEELHRITKNGGVIIIKVPHKDCFVADGCIQHKTRFGYTSFDCLESGKHKESYTKKKFKIISKELRFASLTSHWTMRMAQKIVDPISNKFPTVFERFISRLIGGTHELKIKIRVIK